MEKLKFYIIIPALVSLFLVSCSQSESVEPVFTEEIPSEALPASSYETPLDSVLTRSDRFLGQVFPETRSLSVNRQAEINTLYRPIGTLTRNGETEEIPVHIVNYTTDEAPAGYVILIADERIDDAVVAYSNESNWVLGTIPAFEEMFLERLDGYISGKLQEEEMTTRVGPGEGNNTELCSINEWTYQAATALKLLSLPTKWGQLEPYNEKTPICWTHIEYMPTGCAATAIAQIMAYHKHPTKGSYTDLNGDLVTTSYNWDTMTTSLRGSSLSTEGKDMVADLMVEIGEKVNMTYGCTGSGTAPANAMYGIKKMGYSTDNIDYFTLQKVLDDLHANKPVYMRGDSHTSGHAWVVDGYQRIFSVHYVTTICPSGTYEEITGQYSSYYLRFNLGEEGADDGYYLSSFYNSLYGAFPYQYTLGTITDISPSYITNL